MDRRFQNVAVAIILLFLLSCKTNELQKVERTTAAKNIILLIGDGMGLSQMSTMFYYSNKPSNFLRFKKIGLHIDKPYGNKITDSAAGATAFSTGYKTYNTAIAVDKDTIARKTILEMAAAKGKSTGLVVTSSITHATPACFYAHVKHRNMYEDIAVDLKNSRVDFAAGGGLQFFNKRKDGQNLLKDLKAKGVIVDTTKLNNKHDINKRYAYLLAQDGMPKMQEGRGDYLPNATKAALDYLSQNKKGFFLMVEGSQIDWGGHKNDADYIINEVKDFDKTIGVALDFAQKNNNTLVIVTADHETGGFSLSSLKLADKSDYGQIAPSFSTGGHTATLIPVYAFGPGAEQFMGIYQNNEIFQKMLNVFNIGSAKK